MASINDDPALNERSSHWLVSAAGWIAIGGAILICQRRWGFELRDPVLLLPVLGLLGYAWHLLARRAVRADASAWMELVRVAGLIVVGLAAVYPFLTRTFVGGIDAKWYAHVLADHLEQLRAGVFPVLVGQGSYQFNGAVHPYRFAPLYQNLAGVIDLITGRQFQVPALQHATLIVASVASGLSCYFAFTAWAPRLRWSAWLVSACYVLSPAALALICIHDMYMSFLAAAWIPLALHTARRAAEERTFFSAAKLAAALTLVLNGHAPVGLWTTGVCVGLLGAVLGCSAGRWKTLLLPAATLVFLYSLNAFQFQGIAELSPVGGPHFSLRDVTPPALALLVGAAAALVFLRFKLRRAHARGGAPGSAVERTEGEARAYPAVTPRDWANAILLAALAAALCLVLFRSLIPAPSIVASDTVRFTKRFVPGALLPISPGGGELPDAQPGWALLALGVFAVGVVWKLRDVSAKIFVLVAVFLAACLLPATPFASAFWHSVPTSLIAATSGAVNLRLSPVWAAALAFAGFGALVWLSSVVTARGWFFRGAFMGLALLFVWSAREVGKLHRFSGRLINSQAQTDNVMRPENSDLTIYSGNFIGLSDYFSHGVRDYHFESRLLDPKSGAVDAGLAANAAAVDVRDRFALKAQPGAALPGWLQLTPGVHLEPRERLLLTFAFSRPDWAGILVIEGRYFYREYILPSSGSTGAFGCAPGNGRDLVVWSSAPGAQDLQLRFLPDVPAASTTDPTAFATVEVRAIDVDALPVRTISLVPSYRVYVDARAPAVLETPRTWVPGYEATRNGQRVAVSASTNQLVSVPLVAGANSVELVFVGSRRLQVAFFVSLAAWWFFFGAWALNRRRESRAIAGP